MASPTLKSKEGLKARNERSDKHEPLAALSRQKSEIVAIKMMIQVSEQEKRINRHANTDWEKVRYRFVSSFVPGECELSLQG